MKIKIVSFTKQGCALNAQLTHSLQSRDYFCEGYTLAKYAGTYTVELPVMQNRAQGSAETGAQNRAQGSTETGVQMIEHTLTAINQSVGEWTKAVFGSLDALIFIGAAGIAVRSIAPCVQDKWHDPAVLVIDEKGQFVVPILSGHVGGGNVLATEIAKMIGGQVVLTTATDVQHRFAVDVFAVKNKLTITSHEKAKQISAAILNGETIGIYMPESWRENWLLSGEKLPGGCTWQKREDSQVAVDYHRILQKSVAFSKLPEEADWPLQLMPEKCLWIGIGCRKDTSAEAITIALAQFIAEHELAQEAIAGLASIDVKAEEAGILAVCEDHGWPFRTYSAEVLNQLTGDFSASEFVKTQVGVDNVCERAAVCAADGTLIIKKQKMPGITLAVAIENRRISFE